METCMSPDETDGYGDRRLEIIRTWKRTSCVHCISNSCPKHTHRWNRTPPFPNECVSPMRIDIYIRTMAQQNNIEVKQRCYVVVDIYMRWWCTMCIDTGIGRSISTTLQSIDEYYVFAPEHNPLRIPAKITKFSKQNLYIYTCIHIGLVGCAIAPHICLSTLFACLPACLLTYYINIFITIVSK